MSKERDKEVWKISPDSNEAILVSILCIVDFLLLFFKKGIGDYTTYRDWVIVSFIIIFLFFRDKKIYIVYEDRIVIKYYYLIFNAFYKNYVFNYKEIEKMIFECDYKDKLLKIWIKKGKEKKDIGNIWRRARVQYKNAEINYLFEEKKSISIRKG